MVPIVIPYGSDTPAPTTGDYTVRFIDYDGTILQTSYVDSGESVTPPSDPDHTDIGLTFQEWNYSSSALSSITSDLDVGATYITTDGKTHLYITLTTVSGLSPTIYFNKSDTSTLTIDWGDSSTSTSSSSGNRSASHTYSAVGDYVIKLWISSGSGKYGFGNGTAATVAVGGSTQAYRNVLTKVLIGDGVTSIGMVAFYSCNSLCVISIPQGVTSISTQAFAYCYSLYAINIPKDNTSIPDSLFDTCYSLNIVSLPSTLTTMGGSVFSSCMSLRSIAVQNGVTSFGTYVFAGCFSLARIYISTALTSLGSYTFSNCHSLRTIKGMTGLTSISSDLFVYCYSLESITIPAGVTSIASEAFQYCYAMHEYILAPTIPPSLASTNVFYQINTICKMKAPSASLATYQAASNWSAYANYMEGY